MKTTENYTQGQNVCDLELNSIITPVSSLNLNNTLLNTLQSYWNGTVGKLLYLQNLGLIPKIHAKKEKKKAWCMLIIPALWRGGRDRQILGQLAQPT